MGSIRKVNFEKIFCRNMFILKIIWEQLGNERHISGCILFGFMPKSLYQQIQALCSSFSNILNILFLKLGQGREGNVLCGKIGCVLRMVSGTCVLKKTSHSHATVDERKSALGYFPKNKKRTYKFKNIRRKVYKNFFNFTCSCETDAILNNLIRENGK